MRFLFISALILLHSLSVVGQTNTRTFGKVATTKVINFSSDVPDFDPSILTIEKYPAPAGDYELRKELVDSLRRAEPRQRGNAQRKSEAPAPAFNMAFDGQVSSGTPNDNDMCIGNNGYILSVVNSSIFMYDSTGFRVKSASLAFMARELGSLDRSFDPRVLYDPNHDRFILVFLNGTTSETNTPIIGFSKSNNPTEEWNFYQLPGNPRSDTSWSDYPIISISDKDLFLTLNLLRDNQGWKDGFKESIIWQMSLEDGYNGDSIKHILWSDIAFEGQNVWSICPSQGGLKPDGPNTYFLSARPGDISNDSIFVHTITNSIESGKAELKTKFVRCSQPYGLPPSAPQPNKQLLETNDARVLTAIHQNGLLHFAGNTRDFQNNAAGIWYGVVDPQIGDAQITILSFDTLDLGYPDIAYAGSGNGNDHSILLTCSHVSSSTWPGTSVIIMNYSGQFSPLTRVKSGLGSVDVLIDTFERWGDYNGIQRKYNENRSFWLAGNYGDRINRTVIAKVSNNDPTLAVLEPNKIEAQLYPNPSSDYFEMEFELDIKQNLRFRIIDLQGREVAVITDQLVKAGRNKMRFATTPLKAGTYVLLVEAGQVSLLSERFVVVR